MSEVEIGVVKHFFDRVGVVMVELRTGELAVGDTIHLKGHTTDVTTAVESMQVEHKQVTKAAKGESVGIKIPQKAREQDKVFKVVP